MSVNGMTLRAGQTVGPLLMASAVGVGLTNLTDAYIAASALAVATFAATLVLVR